MSDPSIALGAWWSVANADKTVLGVVVALIAVAAVAFVARRVLARRR
jgi:hypothetical protein